MGSSNFTAAYARFWIPFAFFYLFSFGFYYMLFEHILFFHFLIFLIIIFFVLSVGYYFLFFIFIFYNHYRKPLFYEFFELKFVLSFWISDYIIKHFPFRTCYFFFSLLLYLGVCGFSISIGTLWLLISFFWFISLHVLIYFIF